MRKRLICIFGLCAALAAPLAPGQESTHENNTIVRFDFLTGGTNFGSLDLELFDQEKPVTVENFLLYVRSGQYSNLVLHRLDPGFVMQAGRVRVQTPFSTDVFNETSNVPAKSFGRITNEFGVGPARSNVFGTIAMARVAGQTNSASAEWFINLADNIEPLDTNDGGFTVFGRVIDSAGSNTGTNLLNHFNSVADSNLTSVCLQSVFGLFCTDSLADLPAATVHYEYTTNISTNTITMAVTTNIFTNSFVRVNDLYTMNASIVRGEMLPGESTPPKLAIAGPKRKVPTTTNNTFLLTGTASDDFRVERIVYQDIHGVGIASGRETWSAQVALRPGTNTINFVSIDRFGNESSVETRRVFYSVRTPIAVTNIGSGTILGMTNQQMLEIGRNYVVKARPARKNFFLGYRGSFNNPGPKLTFSMSQGVRIDALFTTNFFIVNRGAYHGLIIPRPNGSVRTAGYLTLKLGPKGVYFGRLSPANANYGLRGAFNTGARTTVTGKRGTTVLVLSLTLRTNGTERIDGTYTDGSDVGDVVLYKAQSFKATAAPQEGNFTFAIGRGANMSDQFGDGFGIGTVGVAANGRVTIMGTMPGSGDFKQKTLLLTDGRWPFHQRPSNSSDVFVGWMQFDGSGTGFEGNLRWLSKSFTNDAGELLKTMGSRYVMPTVEMPLLDWTDGIVTLSGGDLAEAVDLAVALENSQFIVAPNELNLQLSVTPEDGILGGSFAHPVTRQLTPIEGVVVQNSNAAAGFFPGTRSGSVVIRAAE